MQRGLTMRSFGEGQRHVVLRRRALHPGRQLGGLVGVLVGAQALVAGHGAVAPAAAAASGPAAHDVSSLVG